MTPASIPEAEVRSVADRLLASRDVVLTSHVTPDADGIGTAIALVRALRGLGKRARMVSCSTAPKETSFLWRPGEFEVWQPDVHAAQLKDADTVVATDLGGTHRLGKMEQPVREAPGKKIVIDHHAYAEPMWDLPLVVMGVSSSAEVASWVLDAMGVPLTPEIATPLYAGLAADSGWFAYDATSSRALSLAARLVEAGARPNEIWRELECRKSLLKMRVFGELLANLKADHDGRLVHVVIDRHFLKKHQVEPRDTFEVVNHFMRMDGVEAGALFLQLASEKTKVSVRSAGRIDLLPLAKSHGGGGHRFAVGFTADGIPFDGIASHVMPVLRREIELLDERGGSGVLA